MELRNHSEINATERIYYISRDRGHNTPHRALGCTKMVSRQARGWHRPFLGFPGKGKAEQTS